MPHSRFDPARHHRRAVRLPGHGYAGGWYFVTVCTHERACLLGEVVDGAIVLSEAGRAVQQSWNGLPALFEDVVLDAFVVMPNHVHGIVGIMEDGGPDRRGVIDHAPTTPILSAFGRERGLMADSRTTLGKVVRAFKARATRNIRQERGLPFTWQRSYWDRVVRGERAAAGAAVRRGEPAAVVP